MKHYLILVIFLFFGCQGGTEVRIVEDTWPSGREKTVRFYSVKNDIKELLKEIKYYENGRKEVEGSYKKEKRHGKWIYWYDNGNVWSEGEFKTGLSHGYRKVYYPNGKLHYEGTFKDDKPVGTWKFYDEFGRFIKEEKY
jgi:antitoxin component YwqK of YwqJK toxin-antitoxin module